MTTAVINSQSEPKVERREAFETYGPPPVPQQQQQHTFNLPTPVYGPPAISKYPPPPPERPPPPPPGKEYGKFHLVSSLIDRNYFNISSLSEMKLVERISRHGLFRTSFQ